MDSASENRRKLFVGAFGRDPEAGEVDLLFDKRFETILTPTEGKVLQRRYCLDGKKSQTLFEIGNDLGITRKEVYRLEARALRKIRRYCLFPEKTAILPAKKKGCWVLKQNGESLQFDTFEDGIEEFRKRIKEHLAAFPECYIDGLPFDVGAHFFAREESDEITDAELVLRDRLKMLFRLFLADNMAVVNDYAFRAFDPTNKSIHYSEPDLFSDRILVAKLKQEGNEICADLEYIGPNEDTYLHTNALAFANTEMTYYFESHQTVDTGEKGRLGLNADIYVTLSKQR